MRSTGINCCDECDERRTRTPRAAWLTIVNRHDSIAVQRDSHTTRNSRQQSPAVTRLIAGRRAHTFDRSLIYDSKCETVPFLSGDTIDVDYGAEQFTLKRGKLRSRSKHDDVIEAELIEE
jgi:hypothetical protein